MPPSFFHSAFVFTCFLFVTFVSSTSMHALLRCFCFWSVACMSQPRNRLVVSNDEPGLKLSWCTSAVVYLVRWYLRSYRKGITAIFTKHDFAVSGHSLSVPNMSCPHPVARGSRCLGVNEEDAVLDCCQAASSKACLIC